MAETNYYGQLTGTAPATPAAPTETNYYQALTAMPQSTPATDPALPGEPGQRPKFLVDSVGDTLRSGAATAAQMGRGFMGWATGADSREFDLPEIGSAMTMTNPPRNAAGYAEIPKGLGLLALGRDDKQKAGIFMEHNPGSKLKFDKFGNAIVTFGEQDFYLNRPGASGQDFRDLTQGAALLPLASGAAAAGQRVLGPAGRIIGAGLGFGAGGAAQDEGALAAGAPQGATMERGVVDVALGSASEAIAPLAGPAVAAAGRPSTSMYLTSAGLPTAATLQAFERAGIDPSRVTREMVESFAEEARRAADPAAAARAVAARTLPVPVPQSRGSLSGVASDQMFEDQALKGSFGETAATTMRGQRGAEQDALRGNLDAIQGQIAGGAPTVTQSGQGGQMAQAALIARRDAARARADAAYEAARSGGRASMPTEPMRAIAGDLRRAVSDFDVAALPNVQSKLDNFGRLINSPGFDTPVRQLFAWRAQVNNMRKGGGEDAAAAGQLVQAFDRHMDAALNGSVLSGDRRVIAQWREAIGQYRDLKTRWESTDLIGDLVKRDRTADGGRLAVAPEAAANEIFGRANLGFASRPELARELTKMRDLLGPNSPEWTAIKEEAWLRFARAGEGAMEGGTRQFSGANFKKSWDNAVFQNSATLNILFNQEERRLISQFADVAARTTNPVKGGQNFSNTASGLANIVQNVVSRLATGPASQSWLAATFPPAYRAMQGLRTGGAVNAGAPPWRPGPGTVGPAGALVGEQIGQ